MQMHTVHCSTVLLLGVFLRCSFALSNSSPSSSTSSPWKWGVGIISDVFWNKKNLASKTSVRLIKKSWKPKGLAFDEYVDEFPDSIENAYKIMRDNSDYEYVERPLSKATELFTDTEFDRNLNSIIIFHPIFSNADDAHFSKPTITALGMRNLNKKYNIFIYHMPALNINFMFTLFREFLGYETKYEVTAEVISSFILEGLKQQQWTADNLNFIGYSYSGNLAGYVARIVKQVDNTRISSIICLDPYSAGYNENLVQVSKDDAEVVHILHTSSYVQGTRERIGTADFVFNDGLIQPDCAGFMAFMQKLFNFKYPGPFFCSHIRVVPRFWYVILFPSMFKARKCDTWSRFWTCLCEENEDGVISYPIASRSLQGTFYLRSTKSKPYGMGEEGSHCQKWRKPQTKNKRKPVIRKKPKSN